MDSTNNVNLALCLKKQGTIGETVAHNICSDAVIVVPWRTVNRLEFIGLRFEGFGGLFVTCAMGVLLVVICVWVGG